ncbi:hypothetical protein BaRGS_00009622, partial [Batillaria attramentaria]
ESKISVNVGNEDLEKGHSIEDSHEDNVQPHCILETICQQGGRSLRRLSTTVVSYCPSLDRPLLELLHEEHVSLAVGFGSFP